MSYDQGYKDGKNGYRSPGAPIYGQPGYTWYSMGKKDAEDLKKIKDEHSNSGPYYESSATTKAIVFLGAVIFLTLLIFHSWILIGIEAFFGILCIFEINNKQPKKDTPVHDSHLSIKKDETAISSETYIYYIIGVVGVFALYLIWMNALKHHF